MPTWIFVCIWVSWVAVSIQQVNIFRNLAMRPGITLPIFGTAKMWAWLITSIFWIGYNVNLFF